MMNKPFTTACLLAAQNLLLGTALAQVEGTFQNTTSKEVQVYWVGENNQNNAYHDMRIAAGKSKAFNAYPKTRFRFYHQSDFVSECLITAQKGQTHVIGDLPKASGNPAAQNPAKPVVQEGATLSPITFSNQTGMILDLYAWDDYLEQDDFIATLGPDKDITLDTYADLRWSAAASQIRLEMITATGKGHQKHTFKPKKSTATFVNRRLTDVSLYTITNATERFTEIATLRPGQEQSTQLPAGVTVAMTVDDQIIGSARVLPMTGQRFEIVSDAAVAKTPELADQEVTALFQNQTKRKLQLFLDDEAGDQLIPWGELKAGETLSVSAGLETSWVVRDRETVIGSFEITPAPVLEFVITPQDLL